MSALGSLRGGLRAPKGTNAVPCVICGRKGLSEDPDFFIHPGCRGTPRPCECGQPSMPYPPCAHCKGTGRLLDQTICPYCPEGPCVAHAIEPLLKRIREEREDERRRTDPGR